ncbi:MAG: hypothetical protein V1679_02145 [Candidatus Peregrinibacteria bacterium]
MKNIKGLILTEALVALSLLATAALILGSMVNSAAGGTRISKNYLIAQNLATEAIEGVKNVRDTNWLVRPDVKDAWLQLDPSIEGEESERAEDTFSYIVSQEEGQWKMFLQIIDLDINGQINLMSPFRLCKEVFKTETIGDDDLKFEKYVQTGEECDAGLESDFYRSATFGEFVFIDADLIEDAVTVYVKVQWLEGAKVRTIERSTTLYNSI